MNIKVTVLVLAVLLVIIGVLSYQISAYSDLKVNDLIRINEKIWRQTNNLAGKKLDAKGLADGRIIQKNGRDFFSAILKFTGSDDRNEYAAAIYCYSLELQENGGKAVGVAIRLERLAALYVYRDGKFETKFKDEGASCIRQ